MANDHAHARSNYFHVRDAEAFRHAVHTATGDVGIWVHGDGSDPAFLAIYSDEPDTGAWPTTRRRNPDQPPARILADAPGEDPDGCTTHDHEPEEYEHLDLVELIAPHVVDGDVVVLIEVGWQKLHYLFGNAVAFNNAGDRRELDLDEIYDLASLIGAAVTAAEG